MKFLKKFATRAEYEAYMANNENYPHVGYIADEGVVEYVKDAPFRPDKMPLHFEAIEDMTVMFSINAIEYSLDNNVWTELPKNTYTLKIAAGDKVYFRAEGLSPLSMYGIGTFTTTGKFNALGNAMSMIYGADFYGKTTMNEFGLFGLLSKSKIVDASNLILPATTLAKSCYRNMFLECSELVIGPTLPALELVNSCYLYMFSKCPKLSYVKAMFLTEPSSSYTTSWMNQVSATGTFVKNAEATWDVTGVDGVPSGWTVETATE